MLTNSRLSRPVTVIMPLENTNWAITSTTSNGTVCSPDFTNAEPASPNNAEVHAVSRIANTSSGMPESVTTPWSGPGLPRLTAVARIAACNKVCKPITMSFEAVYDVGAKPTARSRS